MQVTNTCYSHPKDNKAQNAVNEQQEPVKLETSQPPLPTRKGKWKRRALLSAAAVALATGIGYSTHKLAESTSLEPKQLPQYLQRTDSLTEKLNFEVESMKAEGLLPRKAEVHMKFNGQTLLGVIDESEELRVADNIETESLRTGKVHSVAFESLDEEGNFTSAQGHLYTERDTHHFRFPEWITHKPSGKNYSSNSAYLVMKGVHDPGAQYLGGRGTSAPHPASALVRIQPRSLDRGGRAGSGPCP